MGAEGVAVPFPLAGWWVGVKVSGQAAALWGPETFLLLRVKELSPHTGSSGEQAIQMETEETESSIGVLMNNVRGQGRVGSEVMRAEVGLGSTVTSTFGPLSSPKKMMSCLPR